MNLDPIVERFSQDNPEVFLEFLTALNPSLTQFFSYFTQNKEKNMEWFEQISSGFYKKCLLSKSAPKQSRLLLFKASFALAKKHGDDPDFFSRINDVLYEDILVEKLPDLFFEKDFIPGEDFKDRFERTLNSPTRMLLDLVFCEHFSTQETADILQISENMLEPFLFTFCQKLCNQHSHEDEFEIFTLILSGEKPGKNPVEFETRLRKLISFLGLDFRLRLSRQDLFEITKHLYPGFSPKNADSEPSLIEKIRRENEEKRIRESANHGKTSDPDHVDYTSEFQEVLPQADLRAFKFVKPAIFVLLLFFVGGIYKTIQSQGSGPQLVSNATQTTVISVAELEKNSSQIGTILDPAGNTTPVFPFQKIESFQYTLVLTLQNKIEIHIMPGTRLKIISTEEFWMDKGKLICEIELEKKEIRFSTPEGNATVTKSRIWIAKPDPRYSVFGCENGEFKVDSRFGAKNLKKGEELVLGIQSTPSLLPFQSEHFEPTGRKTLLSGVNKKNRDSTDSLPKLDEEYIKKILLDEEGIKKNSEVKAKDFLQKL